MVSAKPIQSYLEARLPYDVCIGAGTRHVATVTPQLFSVNDGNFANAVYRRLYLIASDDHGLAISLQC